MHTTEARLRARAGAGPALIPGQSRVEIVVPVRNEECDVEPAVRRLRAFLEDSFPFPARITIAENGSTDGTWAQALALAAESPLVQAVRIERPGRGGALRTIWTGSDADIYAYMDVDLSTDLKALLPLVAPLLSGHSDVAIGTRLARGARVIRGPKREIISRCYNLLLHASLGTRFSDAQCGFKAIRADAARALLPLTTDTGWFFDTELLVLAERAGLRIHEVPVDWVDDADSRVNVMATALGDLCGIVRLGSGLARGTISVPALRSADLHGRRLGDRLGHRAGGVHGAGRVHRAGRGDRAVDVGDGVGRDGRNPRSGQHDAGQVERVGRGDLHGLAGGALLADGAQDVEGVGMRELLAAEPGDEPAAADSAPGLHAPERPQDLAPGQGQILPGHQIVEDHAPADRELLGHGLRQLIASPRRVTGPGSSDHRPADPAPAPLRPRRSPRSPDGRDRGLRRSRDRTARKPSAVTSPRATPSHSASSTSLGRRPVIAPRSGRNSAPCWRRASSTSRVRPGPGSAGARSPRAARSSQGRSSRMARVMGVAREGTSPLRRGAGSGSLSRTDSRPQVTSPDRQASSSHSRR